MKLTFLGTGTSQGIPIIGCHCRVCDSQNPKDKRLRTSALLQIEEKNILIDPGPDFRQQVLRENVSHLNAILLTHSHHDHLGGLDDIRPYNYMQKGAIPLYGNQRALQGVRECHPYIFEKDPYPGVPQVELIQVEDASFWMEGVEVMPIEILHNKLPINAYRIGNFAYITDAKFISEASLSLLKNLDCLIINALRFTPHLSHLSLDECLDIIEKIKPKRIYLTHISHELGLHDKTEEKLPENVHLAYDGLKIDIPYSL